jgi:hypothetical protein
MNPIKKSNLKWDQYFGNTKNKNMKRKKYPFKISLPRPTLLGLGKTISSVP